MKWTTNWLNKNAQPDFTFDESIVYDQKLIKATHGLLDLKDVRVVGNGSYDQETTRVKLNFTVTGTMVVPCAISLEPTDHKFTIEHEDRFSFNDDDSNLDYEIVKGNELDIIALVFELIVISIPLKVVKEGAKYPEAKDNWRVISEDELATRNSNEVDPRLAKLKDYFK